MPKLVNKFSFSKPKKPKITVFAAKSTDLMIHLCQTPMCRMFRISLDRFDTTWHGLVRFFYWAPQKETIRNCSWTKNSFYGFGLISYKKQDKRLTILKTMGLILRYIREKLCQLAFVTLNSAKFIEALKGDQNSIYYSN